MDKVAADYWPAAKKAGKDVKPADGHAALRRPGRVCLRRRRRACAAAAAAPRRTASAGRAAAAPKK